TTRMPPPASSPRNASARFTKRSPSAATRHQPTSTLNPPLPAASISRKAAPGVASSAPTFLGKARTCAESSLLVAAMSAVPIVKQAQPVEGQHVVAFVDGAGFGGDERREPARAHHPRMK